MRSIVITGANRGIGLEYVKQLLALPPTSGPEILIATARDVSGAKALEEVASKDKRLHILELDVANYDYFPTFVSKVSDIVGEQGLTVLLNNAGIMLSREGKFAEIVDAEMLLHQYKTNFVGPILLTKACLPLLKKSASANSDKKFGINRAAIVFTSSFLGSVSLNEGPKVGGFWGYRESKAALNMAARTITHEVKDDGIAVLMLHPGWVATDMGGSEAEVRPTDSIAGLIKIILALDEKTNGCFIRFSGEKIPW